MALGSVSAALALTTEMSAIARRVTVGAVVMIAAGSIGLEAGVWSRMGQIRAKRRPWSRRQRSKARASGVIPSPVVRARMTARRLQCERRGYLQVAIRSARSPEAVVSFASMTHPSSMAMRHI